MRCMEMLKVMSEDIVGPEDGGGHTLDGQSVLALGTKATTKPNRPQVVVAP